MDKKPRLLTILDSVTLALFVISVWMVFFYAPTEAVMGAVQRVFYFHVPSAIVAFSSVFLLLGASVAYLRELMADGIASQIQHNRYFGDLDRTGLQIPATADLVAQESGLPPVLRRAVGL